MASGKAAAEAPDIEDGDSVRPSVVVTHHACDNRRASVELGELMSRFSGR